jgi:propionyl-CoA synthetase
MTASHASRYAETYAAWQRDPEAYWGEIAKGIEWIKPPQQIFDAKAGIYGRWFPDASCNTCFNALDRHVRDGRAEQTALIYDSPVTGTKASFTYAEMLDEVSTLAAVLQDQGVGKGDRVIIYMPMIPEAAFAMLACARIGAVHSVVFGGFAAASELATRIDDATPKLIMTATCGIEPTRVVEPTSRCSTLRSTSPRTSPTACVVLQRPQVDASMHVPAATRTGARSSPRRAQRPQGRLRPSPRPTRSTCSTPPARRGAPRAWCATMAGTWWRMLVATMTQLYDVRPGEVMFWAASDVGWVVGHSAISSMRRCSRAATSILYEGKPVGTPDPGAFWRVISEYKAVAMFTAPTAFSAIRKEDPQATYLKNYDLSQFRTLFLAGERADPGYAEMGRAMCSRYRWSTIGGRPRPAPAWSAIPSASASCR